MSTKTLSRAFALMLAIGATATLSLTPAHANGRTVAQTCINRDDCKISPPNADGSFTIVLDGGGVIWCPSLDGECVVVSPDTVKGSNPRGPIVAAPISTRLPPKAPGPVTVPPIKGKPIVFVPVGVRPIPITKPVGAAPTGSQAPVILLAHGGRGR